MRLDLGVAPEDLQKADAVDRAGRPGDADDETGHDGTSANHFLARLLVEHLPLAAALGHRAGVGAKRLAHLAVDGLFQLRLLGEHADDLDRMSSGDLIVTSPWCPGP